MQLVTRCQMSLGLIRVVCGLPLQTAHWTQGRKYKTLSKGLPCPSLGWPLLLALEPKGMALAVPSLLDLCPLQQCCASPHKHHTHRRQIQTVNFKKTVDRCLCKHSAGFPWSKARLPCLAAHQEEPLSRTFSREKPCSA